MATKRLVKGRAVATTVQGTETDVLSLLDKLKSYYTVIITVVGTALVVVNQLTPVLDFIPVAKPYVTTGIAVLTGVLAFLKKNEQWVEDL